MTTYTKKWEEMEPEQMLENYIRLKNLERERNKKSYENFQKIGTKLLLVR